MSKKLTAVREYLQNTLGFLIELQPWTAAANLPRYLSAGRDFFLLNIEGVKCLLIQTDAGIALWATAFPVLRAAALCALEAWLREKADRVGCQAL